ncbi:MAG: SigB/SigF/SigG family RNA polymerase sigma factor [Streptosporangiales bacterium]|nr:SigB/SigF/SigG family RNA polymerase sigma factor [Streptosporangiales bacterium]
MTTVPHTTQPAVDEELFARLDDRTDATERERIFDELVRRYDWLVRWAARRYANRGEDVEELQQVGYVGLVEAIDRFDAARGVDFVSFARPTVLGEIRRHFRDRRRWIKVPRRLQELKARINAATDELTQRYGRPPTVADLAAELDVDEDEISDALAADDTFAPMSLDTPLDTADGDTPTRLDALAVEDGGFDDLVVSEALWPLLDRLPAREQEMVLLRFYGNKTQVQIADQLGISQMHVSRLLQQTLAALRAELAD